VYVIRSCFSKMHSDIILPSLPWSSMCSLPIRFSNQTLVWISHLFMLIACLGTLILLELNTLLILDEIYKLWSLLCSSLQPPATSTLPGPNILLHTLFSDTFKSMFFP
jgi:hypothetical protein